MLTFADLQAANALRCPACFFPIDFFSPTDWGCALAGEVGELCNLLKKQRRGQDVPLSALAEELADVVCYADLLAQRLGICLGDAVRDKFNKVSERKSSPVYL